MVGGTCARCGGPTEHQNVLDGSHRHYPDCIAYLKRKADSVAVRCLQFAEAEMRARDGNSDPAWSAADTIVTEIKREFGL